MEADSIDAVILTSIHNINYYGDFYIVVLVASMPGVTPSQSFLITTNIDGGQGWRRSYGANIVYTDWQRDNYYRAVRKVVPDNSRRIALEGDHVTIEQRAKFCYYLSQTQFIDIAPATMRMRMIKSAEEIALIKIGAQVADLGGAACVAAIAEDVPEYDVAPAATSAMTREIAKRLPHVELRDTDVVSVWPEYRRCSPSGDDPSPQTRGYFITELFSHDCRLLYRAGAYAVPRSA